MPREHLTRHARRAALSAALLALMAATALRAQRGGAPAGPPPKPLVPIAAGSIVLNPDAHWGDNVSMLGTVDTILSKTVFTMDQDPTASTGKDVLVIAPYLSASVEQNKYFTVVGEVFKFDPVEVAKRAKDNYVLDLPADVAAKYLGHPAVFATGVITAQYVDIGKRQPPPLTAEELSLRNAMVEINTNNTALRAGLDKPDAAALKTQAAALKHGFTTAGGFFQSHNTRDAADWAARALEFVGRIDTAVAASKWDDAKTAATDLNGLCGSCHTAHRERQDDGTYRFKG